MFPVVQHLATELNIEADSVDGNDLTSEERQQLVQEVVTALWIEHGVIENHNDMTFYVAEHEHKGPAVRLSGDDRPEFRIPQIWQHLPLDWEIWDEISWGGLNACKTLERSEDKTNALRFFILHEGGHIAMGHPSLTLARIPLWKSTPFLLGSALTLLAFGMVTSAFPGALLGMNRVGIIALAAGGGVTAGLGCVFLLWGKATHAVAEKTAEKEASYQREYEADKWAVGQDAKAYDGAQSFFAATDSYDWSMTGVKLTDASHPTAADRLRRMESLERPPQELPSIV